MCDGVSEGNFPNPDVVQLAAQILRETNNPAQAAVAICHKVLHIAQMHTLQSHASPLSHATQAVEMNSKDNITCMIVLMGGGGQVGMTTDFTPGSLSTQNHVGFLKAYAAQAEKVNLSLGKAAELRYELVQEKLASPNLTAENRAALTEEVEAFGSVGGSKGSAARSTWFEGWASQRLREGESAGDDDQSTAMLRMLMQQPQLRNMMMQNQMGENEDGRRVRAAPLARLKASVTRHSNLQWDDRMARLADSEGVVKADDASDNTTQVRFPSMLAWLPTEALTDL